MHTESMRKIWLIPSILAATLLVGACGAGGDSEAVMEDGPEATTQSSQNYENYDMVRLLPPDAIPSIDEPRFYSAVEADQEYEADETVIGLEVEGEARAYSTALLSRHEIVNDELRGGPIAVTW